MEYYVEEVHFKSVTLTPNPVQTKTSLKLSVQVELVERQLFPAYCYTGEIYTGEE